MTHLLPAIFLVDVLFFWLVVTLLVQRRAAARVRDFRLARRNLLQISVAEGPMTPQEFCVRASLEPTLLFGYRGLVVFSPDSTLATCEMASSTETRKLPYACWRAFTSLRWSDELTPTTISRALASQSFATLTQETLTSFVPIFDDGELTSVVAADTARIGGARDEELERQWRADLAAAYSAVVPVAHEPRQAGDSADAFFEPTNAHGDNNGFVWLGYTAPRPRVGHGFWRTYALPDATLAVVLCDSVRDSVGDALRMLSARACCDGLVSRSASATSASGVLSNLNRFLWRPEPMGANCFVAVFDSRARVVSYATAGRVFAFCVRWRDEETTVRPLPGHGPVIGDLSNATYRGNSRELLANDTIVLLSSRMVPGRLRVGSAFQQALRERLITGPRLSTDGLHGAIADLLVQGHKKQREQTMLLVQLGGAARPAKQSL